MSGGTLPGDAGTILARHDAPVLRRTGGRLVVDLVPALTPVRLHGNGPRRLVRTGFQSPFGNLVGYVHAGRMWQPVSGYRRCMLEKVLLHEAAEAFSGDRPPIAFGPAEWIAGAQMARRSGARHPRRRGDEVVLDLTAAAAASVAKRFARDLVHDGSGVYRATGVPCLIVRSHGGVGLDLPPSYAFRLDRPREVDAFLPSVRGAPAREELFRGMSEADEAFRAAGIDPGDGDLDGLLPWASALLLSVLPRFGVAPADRDALFALAVRASVDAVPEAEVADALRFVARLAEGVGQPRNEAGFLGRYLAQVALPRFEALHPPPDEDVESLSAIGP